MSNPTIDPTTGEPVPDLLPTPFTAQEIFEHMVNDHGHDDLSDNPDLADWTPGDWREQHAEYHESPEGFMDDHCHIGCSYCSAWIAAAINPDGEPICHECLPLKWPEGMRRIG